MIGVGTVTTATKATAEKRVNLYGMGLEELTAFVQELGEPAYRARQLMEWFYGRHVTDFEAMTNLPKALRQTLAERATVEAPTVAHVQESSDGTRKYLLRVADGETVEAVLIPEGQRLTACLSSQIGCGIGCRFCATALLGLIRNLAPGEIAGQLAAIQQESGRRVTNVVMMGMGEPLANYASVMRALRLMNHPLGFGLGARRLTISTVGIVPRIRDLAREELQVGLAVSLHAADDETRDLLVPINQRYPIAELMAACRDYIEHTRRRVTFEYVLLRDVNDAQADARKLASLLDGMLCHVNLIPFNPVPETGFERPDTAVIKRFRDELTRRGIPATVRRSRGSDIDAACGQLRRRQPV
ncbi:MAG: 23S rRNA (adenine(2503)-C(2))-methyltransferase [Firmicutes bacterium ZCTH02-B6]|nr:MAG: 23S rRNA (adenine(2503)-C(2))-methyltransferase [Firmicutes bacterium ZCTH02-B6]